MRPKMCYDCKRMLLLPLCPLTLSPLTSHPHPSPPHHPPLTSSYHSQSDIIMLLLRLHSSLPYTPSPSTPNPPSSPSIPHPPLTSDTTANQASSTNSSPHDILPPSLRVQRRRGGCWGKSLGKGHWLAPFLLGGDLLGRSHREV